MPIDLLICDATTTTALEAGKAKAAVRQMRDLLALLNELNDINSHANDGTDFTKVETLYGLSSVRVDPTKANGQLMVEFVAGALNAINGVEKNSQCLAMIERVV